MKILIFIIVAVPLIKGLVPTPENVTSPIIQCALELQNISSEKNILVAYTSEILDETNELVSQLLASGLAIEIINVDKDDSTRFIQIPQKFFMHILILRTVQDYEMLLSKLYRTAIWNARGKYILACLGHCDQQKIFELSWSRYVVNIDVILDNDVQVYTYFPYGNGKCGEDIQVEVLGKCGNIAEAFPEKIPQDMHGCTLRALLNIYPPFIINHLVYNDSANVAGYEMVIVNNLIQRTNMTGASVPATRAFSHKVADGKYDGALKYLMEDVCDIALGSLFPNISFFGDFDVTFLYHYIAFSWVVPAAQPGKQWASIVLIFNKTLWLAILVILMCTIVIWWTFARGTSDKHQFEELSICMLTAWYSLLQGGINLPHSFTMRLLVIIWALFTLLLATLYQSQLVSILLTPVYEHQVANTRELVDSDIKIVYKSDYLVRLSNSDKAIDREIVKKGREITFVEHADIAKLIKNNEAFLGNIPFILYAKSRNYTLPSGKPTLYMFVDKEFGNPITMFVKKGYPLLDRFNALMHRFLSNGLLARSVKEATFYATKVEDDSEPKKLQTSHLTGAFFVLMIGINAALLILVAEIVTYRCQKRKRGMQMVKNKERTVRSYY